jgi:hypothetical protein
MSFPRALSTTEKAIAWELLARAELPELDLLREQLEASQAVSRCECGCPTISLSVDSGRAHPTSYSGKPVATADYEGGSLMIWVEHGWLSRLEIYWWSDDLPSAFPPPDQLENHRRG